MNALLRHRIPRRAVTVTLIACVYFRFHGHDQTASWASSEADPKRDPPVLNLTVAEDGWGEARSADVEAVLQSAAREMLAHFPGEKIDSVEVTRGKENPITLFKRNDNGSIAIRLNAGDLYWAQYAYQFAHELSHVLCNYQEADPSNQWVEESLCELSSMFVLRRMGERWKSEPPYPSWKDFAPALTKYADQRINDAALPEGVSLKEWLEKNRKALLDSKGEDRSRNTVVAAALLPLFEAEPEHWPAVRYLNADRPKSPESIESFIQRWHDQTPVEHRALVQKIGAALGIEIQTNSAESSSSKGPPRACRSSDYHFQTSPPPV